MNANSTQKPVAGVLTHALPPVGGASPAIQHPSATSQQLGELPALTGLRFIAALFVFIGHATPALVKFSPAVPLLPALANILTGAGMTLFFVLSGFVIHYNYAGIVEAPARRNLARFFVARFARLYPLYLFVVLADVLLGWRAADLPAVPFYLGLAQSWAYVVPDEHSLLNHLHFAQVSWSISTEWFFYCCYPVVAWLLLGRRSYWGLLPVIAVTLLWMNGLAIAYLDPERINAFARATWGAAAGDLQSGNDYFFAWLLGYSPAGHFQEFLIGVIAAQLFVLNAHHKVTARESWMGSVALAAALLAIVAMYSAQQLRGGRLMDALTTLVLPVSYGMILFYCARYRSTLSAALSSRVMTLGGDASYSIYMFHIVAIISVAIPTMLPLNWYFATYVAVRYVSILVITIILSIAMYQVYEVSTRVATRAALNGWLSRGPTSARQTVIIALAIGIPLALALYGWLLARFPGAWPRLYGLVIVLTLAASVVAYFVRTDKDPPWETAVFAWGVMVAGVLWWFE